MFMSGHPLDHFKFEITHYGITQLGEFNEIKDAVSTAGNPGKTLPPGRTRHRCPAPGNQNRKTIWIASPSKIIPGNAEFMLWSEDYARYSNYLEKGKNLFMTGSFRQRFNKSGI